MDWKQSLITGKMLQDARAVDRRISHQPFHLSISPRKKLPSEKFPDEYYHFSSSGDGDAVTLSKRETAKMIDDTVEEYKKANCGYAFSSTGDTFVAVFQTDEDDINDFLVMVSKDHYEYDFVNGE